jgi:hypothetical protein
LNIFVNGQFVGNKLRIIVCLINVGQLPWKSDAMLRIPALPIPDILPHPDAIKSCGDNRYSYGPEAWEFHYETYRYLGRVEEARLLERYRAIARNMRALVSPDRHVIPIASFLSSWYWYRKEHQTRLEFFLREQEPPLNPAGILSELPASFAAPIRPRHPNAGDVLFRYGRREYMQAMIERGCVRISAASFYRGLEKDSARADEELSKSCFLPGEYTTLTTQVGKKIPVIGDVCRTASSPNYLVLCMSCDWDFALFGDFGADSCVVIRDPDEFARRLELAAKDRLDGWYFYHNPVEYFDPYEMPRKQLFDAAVCKDFRFAHQREYRFLWMNTIGREASGFINLELGPLTGIAELHLREDLAQQ